MKTNMFIIAIIAMIASFAGIQRVNAQELSNCEEAYYLRLASKLGNRPYTQVTKDGKSTYYARTGYYIGVTGGTTFVTQNGELAVDPTATVSFGREERHFHWEVRAGAKQFSYLGEKKIGLVTDAGIYYDFFPAKARKFNIYAGVFAGYQYVRFKYNDTQCIDGDEITVSMPYRGNSFRYGGEVGFNIPIHYTHSVGAFGRVYSYSYDAGGEKFNPVVGEVGIRLTFGLGRKVKL